MRSRSMRWTYTRSVWESSNGFLIDMGFFSNTIWGGWNTTPQTFDFLKNYWFVCACAETDQMCALCKCANWSSRWWISQLCNYVNDLWPMHCSFLAKRSFPGQGREYFIGVYFLEWGFVVQLRFPSLGKGHFSISAKIVQWPRLWGLSVSCAKLSSALGIFQPKEHFALLIINRRRWMIPWIGKNVWECLEFFQSFFERNFITVSQTVFQVSAGFAQGGRRGKAPPLPLLTERGVRYPLSGTKFFFQCFLFCISRRWRKKFRHTLGQFFTKKIAKKMRFWGPLPPLGGGGFQLTHLPVWSLKNHTKGADGTQQRCSLDVSLIMILYFLSQGLPPLLFCMKRKCPPCKGCP